MADLELTPTGKMRCPRLFQPNTELVRRSLLEGIARQRPDDVVAMVTRARSRGVSYERIAAWLGPRASCPPPLLPLRDRLELLAELEANARNSTPPPEPIF